MARGRFSLGRAAKTGGSGAALLALLAMLPACDDDKGPALSKMAEAPADEDEMPTPDLGRIDDKLVLGALLDRTPVYSAASKKAPVLGYLHAGAQVNRTKLSHENEHCTEGWYAVAPRGYVCTEKGATTNAEHPTLIAMSLPPNLAADLPYTYARTTKVTAVLANNGRKGVEMTGRLGKSTVLAVVGSWTAPDETREPQRLGLKLDGKFVRVGDLKAAESSKFSGTELTSGDDLPVGFVVRRGVRAWSLKGQNASKGDVLSHHAELALTGRFRTIEGERFWAMEGGRWVRHKDVTTVRRRHKFPEFVTEDTKWIDVSVITGTLVAYEGKKPVYATLVSVGRDRLGDPELTASTARGSFRVVSKQITRLADDTDDTSLLDAPWAMALESGQWLIASPRHNRFGIEHTDGDIEISPADGAWLWRWVSPSVPEGWHGVRSDEGETTIVNVRK